MSKLLFGMEDIKPQLSERQVDDLGHIVWMAKDTGEPQGAKCGKYGRRIAVFPSGMMMLIPDKVEGDSNQSDYICKKKPERTTPKRIPKLPKTRDILEEFGFKNSEDKFRKKIRREYGNKKG